MRAKLSLLNINPKFLVLNSYILDNQILLVHIKNSMHFTYTVIKKIYAVLNLCGILYKFISNEFDPPYIRPHGFFFLMH